MGHALLLMIEKPGRWVSGKQALETAHRREGAGEWGPAWQVNNPVAQRGRRARVTVCTGGGGKGGGRSLAKEEWWGEFNRVGK